MDFLLEKNKILTYCFSHYKNIERSQKILSMVKSFFVLADGLGIRLQFVLGHQLHSLYTSFATFLFRFKVSFTTMVSRLTCSKLNQLVSKCCFEMSLLRSRILFQMLTFSFFNFHQIIGFNTFKNRRKNPKNIFFSRFFIFKYIPIYIF